MLKAKPWAKLQYFCVIALQLHEGMQKAWFVVLAIYNASSDSISLNSYSTWIPRSYAVHLRLHHTSMPRQFLVPIPRQKMLILSLSLHYSLITSLNNQDEVFIDLGSKFMMTCKLQSESQNPRSTFQNKQLMISDQVWRHIMKKPCHIKENEHTYNNYVTVSSFMAFLMNQVITCQNFEHKYCFE